MVDQQRAEKTKIRIREWRKAHPEVVAKWHQAWRKANPEVVAKQQREDYQRNREKILAYAKQYVSENKAVISAKAKARRLTRTPEQKAKEQDAKRRTALLRRYGISVEDYELLLAAQNGQCALCSRTPDQERYKRLNVDHCHGTGAVRGLLCTPCNHALGVLGDTAEHLERAARYIRGQ